MSGCGSGCVVRGDHAPGCSGWVPSDDSAVVECWGCLPRPAVQGVLCAWCWGRMQATVRTLPSVVEHLVDVAEPSTSSPSGRRSVGAPSSRPSERALYAEALVQADDLHAALVSWALEVAEEASLRVGVPRGGTRWTADGGDPVGLAGRGATRRVVGWLVPHLEWVATRSWAPVMLEELASMSSSASRRFPVEEPQRRVTDVRCPGCGCLSLVVVQPAVVGADRLVRCTLSACGRVLSEDDWARARRWAVAVATADAGEGEAA
ncbi:Uncharacterised protein [Actinomyces howellii]|uniref:Uncharacterized protein n=1 Tax=Actinomyces howellii TaxID=52771 RepID=A0A448HGN1_9ACTO|nr:Uncharacterised protein [Actinomyces howellii]